MSSAFFSNITLRYADRYIRESGVLAAAVAASPAGTERVVITPDMVGVIGDNLGHGFERVKGYKVPDIATGFNSAGGVYDINPSNGLWETITLHPGQWKP